MAVRTAAVRPGDIVECSVRGRQFIARVAGAPTKEKGSGFTVLIEPITPGINYFKVRGRDLTAHYKKLGRA